MKTKYSAKMRIFLFLLMICITAGACSKNMKDTVPENETVNTDDIGQDITAVPSDTVLPTAETPDLTVSIQALGQMAAGAVSLSEAMYRPDVTVAGNQEVLEKVFVRKPILVEDHF